MKPLNKKQLADVTDEILKNGISKIIDAQNRKGVLKKIRGIKIPDSPEVVENFEDETLKKLSMKESDIIDLINKLNKTEDKTKISDIDWKKVRSI